MHPATETSLTPAPGKAVVVFVRPNDVLWVYVAIAGENGEYVAAVGNSKHVAVDVTPGRHVYYAASEGGGDSEPVVVEAAAGKVYYVRTYAELSDYLRVSYAKFVVLRQKDKQDIDRFLHATQPDAVDPVVAQAYIDKWGQSDRWQGVLAHGREKLAKYSPEEREKLTLHAEDGF
jgi:hypothetical protein